MTFGAALIHGYSVEALKWAVLMQYIHFPEHLLQVDTPERALLYISALELFQQLAVPTDHYHGL